MSVSQKAFALPASDPASDNDEKFYTPSISVTDWVDEWSFKSYNTSTYSHKIHRYPAMFVPQLVRKIIERYSKEGDVVLDIFNGSGSTMVESCVLNRDSIGIEINPLANLIAKVKTTPLDMTKVAESLEILESRFFDENLRYEVLEFKNIDFWYEESAKQLISKAISIVDRLGDADVKDFLKVSLSEILREFSTCRHGGFKMHRDLAKVGKEIDALTFWTRYRHIVERNYRAMDMFSRKVAGARYNKIQIQGSATEYHDTIGEGAVDLILTSPPYGDSQTTVAYGQFSRLSAQFLGLSLDGLEDIGNLDKELLGGKHLDISKYHSLLAKSLTLQNSYELFQARIADASLEKHDRKKMIKRLNDVLSFYYDLDKCLAHGAAYLKQGRYFILVTGSRVVKMIKLHTDIIISELAEHHKLALNATFYRNIENKRIARKVSATNVVGEHAPTMTRESIIILKKG